VERCTYRLDLAYLGDGFQGFRRVAGARTIESVLLSGIARVLPKVTSLAAGGQTDRGVHALGQVVSCYGPPVELAHLVDAVRSAAPGEIALRNARVVARRFHARSCALARWYRYRLPSDGIDFDRLAEMIRRLSEASSLDAFARDTRARGSSLDRAETMREGDHIVIDFEATRFLRRQIRVMVATALRCVAAGEGSDALLRLAIAGDRGATSPPAPADGLALMRVSYAEHASYEQIGCDDPLPSRLLDF
jgi:tRNA pseudouridine38-40 synthase